MKPETAHPAFDKACHLFGVEVRNAPVDPVTHDGRRRRGGGPHRRPDDRHRRLGLQLRLRHDRPDRGARRARARAGRRPARRRLPRRLHPPVRPGARLRHPAVRLPGPGVTSISADTHKYGYALQGHVACLLPRQGAPQQPVLLPAPTGPAASTARRASRARARAGCSPPTWASMVHLGREGYLRLRRGDLRDRRRDEGRPCGRTPSCGSWARPTFCFSFTSDEFDIYHVNDSHAAEGLAVQRPAVPERDPHGGHPAADPARRGRGASPPTSPRPSRTPRRSTRRARRRHRRDLRRRRRRPDRGGRRVHPRRHGRHARHASTSLPPAARHRRRTTPRRAARPRGRPRHGRAQGRVRLAHRPGRLAGPRRRRDPLAPGRRRRAGRRASGGR